MTEYSNLSMPCSRCSSTLAYDEDKELLYCPTCLALPVADGSLIKQKADQIRTEYLNTPKLIEILDDFGGLRVVAQLVLELNEGAAGMTNENNMSFRKFFSALPILLSVYEEIDDFDNHFDPRNEDVQEEICEHVEAVLDAGTLLIPILKQIREDFIVTLEYTPGYGQWTDFYGNHDFLKSEYWLCSERCLRANVGAREETREDFLNQQTIFRSFDKPEKEDIDSVRDWADFWYGLIVNLGFAASLEDSIKGAFTTQFPDSVTIFDIEEMQSQIGSVVEEPLLARESGDFRPAPVREDEFDVCGQDVFGDDWADVKRSLVVSSDTPDAHPMFFRISGTEAAQMPGWRQPRPIPFTRILFPDQFSQVLKFQLFPFLENGDLETSTDALSHLTAQRGQEFERHVFEYLDENTQAAFHSCKTSRQNGNEVDLIFTLDDVVYFVESKFVLPTLNMQSQTGIKDVNSKFDGLIFKEETSGTGKPFPEKVDAWRNVESGTEISHQASRDPDDREWISFPDEWQDCDFGMLVVSNFVPSYLEKHGVRFITDLELYQWIEGGDDVFYNVLDSRV